MKINLIFANFRFHTERTLLLKDLKIVPDTDLKINFTEQARFNNKAVDLFHIAEKCINDPSTEDRVPY